MNCKPGDLAVVVRGTFNKPGTTLRCLRLATAAEVDAWLPGWTVWDVNSMWVTDRPMAWGKNTDKSDIAFCSLAPDGCLRPIRDPGDDATDEMIVLLGKPVREGETA